MEKIAIISDIHGNLTALISVLTDIEKRNIKTIYCLGDIIAKGVHPSECLQLLREKCEIIIRGNCDEIMCSHIEECNGLEKERRIWNSSMLTPEEIDYLLNLPYCHEFYMSGSLIRLFHATPEKINGLVSNLDTFEQKRNLFLPTENTLSSEIADIVIYGHTHLQFMDKIYNRTIINVGSVGNPIDIVRNDNLDAKPMEITQANYLIVEGKMNSKEYDSSLTFQFVRVPYDIEKELSSPNINIEKSAYITELQEGKYRDTKKLSRSLKSRNIDMTKF